MIGTVIDLALRLFCECQDFSQYAFELSRGDYGSAVNVCKEGIRPYFLASIIGLGDFQGDLV